MARSKSKQFKKAGLIMSDEKKNKEEAEAAFKEAFNSLHPIVKSILIGGVIGSIVPVVGTVIGAIIGGVVWFLWFKNKDKDDNEDNW
jgi:uncharacterized protein (DUF2062 family)